jgi:hypothetical protein
MTSRPSEPELRRGEAAIWGKPGPAPIKLLRWMARPNSAGTVLGYCDVELPSGLIICDLRLMIGQKGERWIAMPAEQQRNRDGQIVLDDRGKRHWRSHVDFRDNSVCQRFCDQVLAAPHQKHPDLFVGEPE